MPQQKLVDGAFRVSDLSTRHPTRFELQPDAEMRKDIAQRLDIAMLRKLRFEGEVAPEGKRGWVLNGQLGATVVQPCGVTLEPVTTRIEEEVVRHYVPEDQMAEYDAGAETEMPEDDNVDALSDIISPQNVMIEALSLALPAYPRAPGVSLEQAVFAEDGVDPLTDEDVKPFAGLAALKDKLGKKD